MEKVRESNGNGKGKGNGKVMERVMEWKSNRKGNGIYLCHRLEGWGETGINCKSNGKGNRKVMEWVMEFTCVTALKAGERLRLKLQE